MELIDGQVIFKVAQGRLHYAAVMLVIKALLGLEEQGLYTATQGTVPLDDENAPEPDVFVTRENPALSTKAITGGDLVLAVEVGVTTLRVDRRAKARLYAEAGVPEYWIVNPVARQIEVRREPAGSDYASVVVYGEDEAVSPLIAPGLVIAVASLMPPPDPV